MAMLIDYFPNWISEGIFNSVVLSWAPWVDEMGTVGLAGLDIEYFGNRSGYKQASPLVDKLCARLDNRQLGQRRTELDTRLLMLRNALKAMYQFEWQKLWDIWKQSYEPLYNYNMKEVYTGSKGETETKDTETSAKSTTDMSTENSVKPLNASSFEPLTKSETDMETTRTKTNNTEGVDRKLEGEDEYTKTRQGNIGTLSYQDMVQKEIDLRKQKFFDIIMSDLDKVLTIPYWE